MEDKSAKRRLKNYPRRLRAPSRPCRHFPPMSGRAVCFISQQRQQTCITTQQPDTRRRRRNNESWAKKIASKNATRRIPMETIASKNVTKTSQQRSTSKNDRTRKRNEQNPDKNDNKQKQGKQERGQVPQTELRRTRLQIPIWFGSYGSFSLVP